MQVLPVLVPYIQTTSNLAISCRALRDWLANNGFAIRTSERDLVLENLTFYKLLEHPHLDEWTVGEFPKAINGSDCNRLLALLQGGVNIDAKDSKGNTALMYAAWNGQIGCMKLLLQHGADLHVRNEWGDTPLITAARYGKTECLKLLLEHGAKVTPYLREKYPQYSYLWGDSTL